MSAIRLVLDITKREANVLFDKATGKRMTFRKPLIVVPFISENMRRSIVNGKVIDVDGVTGIKVKPELCRSHARVLELMKIEKVDAPESSEEETHEEPATLKMAKEEVAEEAKTEEVAEEKPKARTSKAKATTKEEGEK